MVRIGTRASRLARWQADWVAERLRALEPRLEIELVEIKTHGDRDRNSPLAAIGGAGLFTKEIQRAVLDHSVDLAVHSLKDLPTQHTDGLMLAAVPAREDVADALIAPVYRTLESLPPRARVGTSAPRRRAQLLHLRPDLQVISLRGNVETRLDRALSGDIDAVVLACAGLHRLGLTQHISQRLEPPRFLPAVGQGALGIECRCENTDIAVLLKSLTDEPSYRAVAAERATLGALQGGCALPMGAWARDLNGDEPVRKGLDFGIDAAVFDLDGHTKITVSLEGPRHDSEGLGQRAARSLLEQGAGQLLARNWQQG
jgi:hydroxymethylbilane synthase